MSLGCRPSSDILFTGGEDPVMERERRDGFLIAVILHIGVECPVSLLVLSAE